MRAVAPYAARNFAYLYAVSGRQRSKNQEFKDRRRCEDAMAKRCEKMIRYNVKVDNQIYQVDLEKDTTTQGAEKTESSADICFEAIKAEYDYCVTRAEKLENKVYILLAACAFVFALLTTQIEKAGELGMPQSGSELFGIIIYAILLVVAVISNVGMLVMTVSLLKSVRFERLDSGLLLTEGVPDEKDTTAVRFIGRLYVQHTVNNNAVLEKGYTAFNRCVDAFCVSIVALIALAIISIF